MPRSSASAATPTPWNPCVPNRTAARSRIPLALVPTSGGLPRRRGGTAVSSIVDMMHRFTYRTNGIIRAMTRAPRSRPRHRRARARPAQRDHRRSRRPRRAYDHHRGRRAARGWPRPDPNRRVRRVPARGAAVVRSGLRRRPPPERERRADGLPLGKESGTLTSAVGLTNTHSVGVVRDALVQVDGASEAPAPTSGRCRSSARPGTGS